MSQPVGTNKSERKVVAFGAGAAGKGLVGLLFSQAGYQVTYVDIKDDLVQRLKTSGAYQVRVHRLEGGHEDLEVSGFRILHASRREAIAREIADAKFVLTAVLAPNLPDVAQTVALGVQQCLRSGRSTPLNCIACENMKNSSSTLGRHVRELLSPEAREYCDAVFAFPDCMINRVVPNPRDPLRLDTEDYCEWTLDADAFKGVPPDDIGFIECVHDQASRLDRKLMVYNGSHAACAYFGFHHGHRWLHEVVGDPGVAEPLDATLGELSTVVQRHHGFSDQSMADYRRDFWLRCRNEGLRDEVARIGRQPMRKLGRGERLVAPAKLAYEYGLPRGHILHAIVAALTFRHPEDPESLELAARLARDGWRSTLSRVSDLEPSDPLLDEIEGIWC